MTVSVLSLNHLRRALAATALAIAPIALTAQPNTNSNPMGDIYGHLGIGTTTPHTSAMLELAGTDAGFLMPRLTSAERNAVAGPASSLLLFNTTTNEFNYFVGAGGGFFSDGWDAFVTTNNLNAYGWRLVGNNGTNPANHFLGTTDPVALGFRTNNTERMRIASAGNVGIGTTAPNPSALLDVAGSNAGFLMPRLTTAERNAIASPVLSLLAFNATTSEFNYFVGAGGGFFGDGWDALMTTNNLNSYAWRTVGNSGTNPAINFIGTTDAVDLSFRTNSAERMSIASGGNVTIGAGGAASQKLEVRDGNLLLSNTGTAGELRFAEPSAGGANYTAFRAQAQTGDVSYTLPAADGTATQVLTTDGAGNLSWTPGSVAFRSKSADQSSNSTTLANDNDLFITVAANSTYTFETVIFANEPSNGLLNSEDIELAFSFPAGATLKWGLESDIENRVVDGAGSTGILLSNLGDQEFISIKGILVTGGTAGTLQFRWAKDNNGGGGGASTVVRARSYMKAVKVQ